MTAHERSHALTYLYTRTPWFNMAPDKARPAITTFYLGYIAARGYCVANIEAALEAAHWYMLGWEKAQTQLEDEPAS